jgi:hypothetical protein
MFERAMKQSIALAACLVAVEASAQSEGAAALKRRVDSLTLEHQRVNADLRAWRERDSVARAEFFNSDPALTVVRVGPIRILADTALAGLAEKAGVTAWRALSTTFGSEVARLSGELWFLRASFDTLADSTVVKRGIMVGWHEAGGVARFRELVSPGVFGGARAVGIAWTERGDDAMHDMLHGKAHHWTPSRLWAGIGDKAVHAGIFRELAAGHAPEGRRCLNGDNSACVHVLAANTVAPGIRTSESARRSLLRAALTIGGDGAYARLAADTTDSVLQLLESTSGLSSDSLITAWRAQVIAARPAPVSTPPRTVFMAVVWGAVLCVISLRSSRWR